MEHRAAPVEGTQTCARPALVDIVMDSSGLHMAATFKLEPAVARLIAQDGVRRLVFDLAEVRFIEQ